MINLIGDDNTIKTVQLAGDKLLAQVPTVKLAFLGYDGEPETVPGQVDPTLFKKCELEEAKYLAALVTLPQVGMAFFGINLNPAGEDPAEFILEQVKGIVLGNLTRTAAYNKDAAILAYKAAAELCRGVKLLNEMHQKGHECDHPNIRVDAIPTYERMAVGFDKLADALERGTVDHSPASNQYALLREEVSGKGTSHVTIAP